MRRWPVLLALAAAAAFAPAQPAMACSRSAEAYLDSFLDDACLGAPLPANNIELDAAGGLRLTTNSPSQHTVWDTEAASEFGTSVGTNTLTTTGTGTATVLELGATDLPLLRDPVNVLADPGDNGFLAGLAAPDSTVPDNDRVDDPAVIKVGAQFVMYYAGSAEDGSPSAIFQATSADGINWTKTDPNGAPDPDPQPVLEGTTDAFDERGVFGPAVVYDPSDSDPSARYKMWYSGRGDVFTDIGYATSADGLVWDKLDDEEIDPSLDADTDADPVPVVMHGRAGAADSFAAQEPTVVFDAGVWHMWYTGDDSTKKRIAYATSTDATRWSKGGMVIGTDPGEDGATNPTNANIREGVFSPSVIKSGGGFRVYFGGRKFLSNPPRFQTRIFTLTSNDGVTWGGGLTEALGATAATFDDESVSAPEVMADGSTFRMWYSGNSSADPSTAHQRIGYAQGSSAGNLSGQTASTGPARCQGAGPTGCVVDIGTPETAFDARQSSGPSVAKPAAGNYVGFYWGVRGSDFKPRLGLADSTDGTTWTKSPVVGNVADGGAVFALPTAGNPFDRGGHRDPSVVYDQDTDLGDPDYHLYFTALTSAGARSIGYASSNEQLNLKPGTWTAPSQVLPNGANGSFDEAAVSHPSVVKNAAGNFILFYTGTNDSGTTAIGRAAGNTVDDPDGPWTRSTTAVLSATLPFENGGVKDPAVYFDGTTYHMTYTAVEGVDLNGDGTLDVRDRFVERIAYATSSDGTTWTKEGLALDSSGQPFAYDEQGVGPAGYVAEAGSLQYYFDGIDRSGRLDPGRATTALPFATGKLENGSATYQFGPGPEPRDFRKLIRDKLGTGRVELWMSFLQPYQLSGGTDAWSSYFPVIVSDAANAEAALSFLLNVKAVRWQARLSGPGGNPQLDEVDLEHGAVAFSGSGSATTTNIDPPSGQTITRWTTLTAVSREFPSAGAAGGTLTVTSADGATQLATAPLVTNGETTIDLAGISAATHPALRVRLDLTSTSPFSTTPLVKSLKVGYFTNVSQPSITLAASSTSVSPGEAVTLSGTVTKGGAPLAGEPVTIAPGGATATTDAGGNYSLVVNPAATTSYTASAAGATSPPVTVTVVAPPAPPPPPSVTLTAAPAEVVFGQAVTLAGRVTQGGAALPNLAVQLLASGTPFATPTTNAGGDYTAAHVPQANTVYSASVAGAATNPSASVGVHQLVKLTARRSRGNVVFSGSIAPAHAGKSVVIQQKKGTAFVTFATAKTGSTSRFSARKRIRACGKFQFRAVSAADADHMDGTSAIALLEKHRVALKTAVRGRTVTFTGKVSPPHRSGRVVVRELKGRRLITLGRARLTRRSTFRFAKKLARGGHRLRVDMAADRCHFAGSSPVRSVRLR